MSKLLIGCTCVLAVALVANICWYHAKATQWQAKYELADAARQVSVQTVEQLLQENADLMVALEQWKSRYAQINRENADAKAEIDRLSLANREMCAFLDTGIPDDVWGVLFPKTAKPAYCPN